MIGNDVIDLELARSQSNWKRKGFLEKIFTVSEQQIILEAADPEVLVWILWSRKEAAYKILNRETLIRTYNPLRFECGKMQFISGFYFGTVAYHERQFFTKTSVDNNFIHTIAVNRKTDFNKVQSIDKTNVLKKGSIPYIYDAYENIEKPVSLSHHGKYQRIVSIG